MPSCSGPAASTCSSTGTRRRRATPSCKPFPRTACTCRPTAPTPSSVASSRFSGGRVAGDDAKAPGVEIGRPSDTYRRVRIASTFGNVAVLVTDGHLPYPYGRELTGYEVARPRCDRDQGEACRRARAGRPLLGRRPAVGLRAVPRRLHRRDSCASPQVMLRSRARLLAVARPARRSGDRQHGGGRGRGRRSPQDQSVLPLAGRLVGAGRPARSNRAARPLEVHPAPVRRSEELRVARSHRARALRS